MGMSVNSSLWSSVNSLDAQKQILQVFLICKKTRIGLFFFFFLCQIFDSLIVPVSGRFGWCLGDFLICAWTWKPRSKIWVIYLKNKKWDGQWVSLHFKVEECVTCEVLCLVADWSWELKQNWLHLCPVWELNDSKTSPGPTQTN